MNLETLTSKTENYIKSSKTFKKNYSRYLKYYFDDITIMSSFSCDWIRVYKGGEMVFLTTNYTNCDPKKPFHDRVVNAIKKKEVEHRNRIAEEF